ncbi:MAG: hypothetical protein IJZ04_03635 [Clostridia bacterium]|nr:hypothetical protein [Clostridia bacterium]
MTNEAINEIKKAEDNASQLIVNARTEARYRTEQTAIEIEKAKQEAEQGFKRMLAERLSKARENASAERERAISSANETAQQIKKDASARLDEVADIIIAEIKALWQ